jgi:hypothetical protein
MYQSISDTTDDSAIGMDVFSTLFVIFVLITAVGTILMGAVNIPKEASYIRVYISSEINRSLPLCIGEKLPCNSMKNSEGDLSALYINVEQGIHQVNIYVENFVSLKDIIDNDPLASIEVYVIHPLLKNNISQGVFPLIELYKNYKLNPNSPILSFKPELNYESL